MTRRIPCIAVLISAFVTMSIVVEGQEVERPKDTEQIWEGRPEWIDLAMRLSRGDKSNRILKPLVYSKGETNEWTPRQMMQIIYARPLELSPSVDMQEFLLKTFRQHNSAIEVSYEKRIKVREEDVDIREQLSDFPELKKRDQLLSTLAEREQERSEAFSESLAATLDREEELVFLKQLIMKKGSYALLFPIIRDELLLSPEQAALLAKQFQQYEDARIEAIPKAVSPQSLQLLSFSFFEKEMAVLSPEQLRAFFLLRGTISEPDRLEDIPDHVTPELKTVMMKIIKQVSARDSAE